MVAVMQTWTDGLTEPWVQVHDLDAGVLVSRVRLHGMRGEASMLHWSPHLAAISHCGDCRVVCLREGHTDLALPRAATSRQFQGLLSSAGLLAGVDIPYQSQAGSISVWHVSSGRQVHSSAADLPIGTSAVWSPAVWSPCGRVLATRYQPAGLWLLICDAQTMARAILIPTTEGSIPVNLLWSPTGTSIMYLEHPRSFWRRHIVGIVDFSSRRPLCCSCNASEHVLHRSETSEPDAS